MIFLEDTVHPGHIAQDGLRGGGPKDRNMENSAQPTRGDSPPKARDHRASHDPPREEEAGDEKTY
eukprot:8300002-Prorocentrum_lima.AAC.1